MSAYDAPQGGAHAELTIIPPLKEWNFPFVSSVNLVTAVVGLVTVLVTTYLELRRRKEKNPSPSQPGKDSNKNT